MNDSDAKPATAADRLDRFRGALQALYADLDAEVAALAPVCVASGRCCRFVAFDHTLFLSALEAELLLTDAPPPVRPLDEGATCPWQDDLDRCRARDARPLGCRVFFCDPAYRHEAPRLSERYIMRLRRLAESHGLTWDYAPLHAHLQRAATEGRFPVTPAAPAGGGESGPPRSFST